MCTIDWKLLLEYLKVVLDWPPITLVIAIIFLNRFHPSISNFIKRLTEGNFFGQSFKAAPPEQVIANADTTLTSANESKLDEAIPPEIANDPKQMETVEWVRKNPAKTVFEYNKIAQHLNFEKIFNTIYGTQIAILLFLSTSPSTTLSKAQLAKYHLEYLSKSGSVPYELADYINFLVIFGLISADADPQLYKITPHGIDFMSYIKSNYPHIWFRKNF